MNTTENNGHNCNSQDPVVDKNKTCAQNVDLQPSEFGKDYDSGSFRPTDKMMDTILAEKCGTQNKKLDKPFMDKIISANCGCKAEYAADYNADEIIADSVELAASKNEESAEFAGDQFLPEGESLYSNTGDYVMVLADNAQNHANPDDDIFNCQGS